MIFKRKINLLLNSFNKLEKKRKVQKKCNLGLFILSEIAVAEFVTPGKF